ncbi:peroxidase 57-like [Chenopodium quinoa]|uniref:peroxidase 57-like n=1 Tax=Chenopodium quinoa TaxID=63459 RepID=UPI000B78BE48|nr:peroxidase 57-like [Chenopodium quinoa]
MRRNNSSMALLALGLIVMTLAGQCYGQLVVGFYNGQCGDIKVEEFIRGKVQSAFLSDKTLAAAMLRMLFHDCFVRGCDASLLLDGENTEKTAGPNRSVRGYELIDDIKRDVENVCPNKVSCADIIVIVTRATVELASSGAIAYNKVETGRRDGETSLASDAMSLPPPNVPVSQAITTFGAKGFTPEDFVLLLGAHTVGKAQCVNFQDRMYNFNGKAGRSDPRIDSTFLNVLKNTCPENGMKTNLVDLDQISPNEVDKKFYDSIIKNLGVLQIDQDIAYDRATRRIVEDLAANKIDFNVKFALALDKLARLNVLTGLHGQIRTTCRMVNKGIIG